MKTYWRIKRADYFSIACELKRRFPELDKTSIEIIEDNIKGWKYEMYEREKVRSPFWMRLTLPFAVLVLIVLLIYMPINFMITGKWGYKIDWLANWFRQTME